MVALKPNYHFEKIQRVALVSFEDYPKQSGSGEIVSSVFEQSLMKSRYQIVERQRVNKILDEQAFTLSGAVDSKTVKQIGDLLGVDAMIMGNVTAFRPEKETVIMVNTIEESNEPIIRKKQEKIKQGDRWVTVEKESISYRQNRKSYKMPQTQLIEAKVGLAVRMVDVQTGEVLWTANGAVEASDTEEAAEILSRRIMKSVQKSIAKQMKLRE